MLEVTKNHLALFAKMTVSSAYNKDKPKAREN